MLSKYAKCENNAQQLRNADLAVWEKMASEFVHYGPKHVQKFIFSDKSFPKSSSSDQMSAKWSEQETLVAGLFSVSLQP
jgi:hypothetical protein